MNFSGTVGGINLILFALESVSEDASFDYNKTIIRTNLIILKLDSQLRGIIVMIKLISTK